MDYLNVERITKDDEIGCIIHEKILHPFCTSYVLIGEDRTPMPEEFLKNAERIKHFGVRNDDVWIASFPKTGTTWTQEMVWMMSNNLDFEGGKAHLYKRSPFLELSGLFDQAKLHKTLNLPEVENSVEQTKNQKSPRFIKTHLPFSLLPDQIKEGSKKPKIIYVMRNPKDTCVSFCHHANLIERANIDVESFTKLFLADKVMYSPFWKHIFGFWDRRDSLNILFVKYEDMKADLPSVIKKVAKFLEKELTDEQINLLEKHLSFESMKNNKSLNREEFVNKLKENNLLAKDGAFMRKGIVNQYKEELSLETIEKLDAWIKKNIAGTSLEKEFNFY